LEVDDDTEVDALAVDSSRFFEILGYDRDDYFIHHRQKKQVVKIKLGSLNTSAGRIELANKASWWTRHFPLKGGVDVEMAMDWFVTVATRKGIYDPSMVRGRGAWMDNGRLVFHFGNTLMGHDQRRGVPQNKSDYIYELRRKLPYPDDVAMSNEDGKRIVDVAKRFRWVNPASAYLLTGWVALAPVCGALRWRPHAWLTGEAGSGKTHIQNDFSKWLTSGICLYAQGNSTE